MKSLYSMLVYFQRGERIENSFLRRKGFTDEEIQYAVDEGYLVKIESPKHDRYMITEKGCHKRDD